MNTIEQAANKLAGYKWSAVIDPAEFRLKKSQTVEDFKAGAQFILDNPELMRETLFSFLEFMDNNVFYKKDGVWHDGDCPECGTLTDDELFTLYLDSLKQKP